MQLRGRVDDRERSVVVALAEEQTRFPCRSTDARPCALLLGCVAAVAVGGAAVTVDAKGSLDDVMAARIVMALAQRGGLIVQMSELLRAVVWSRQPTTAEIWGGLRFAESEGWVTVTRSAYDQGRPYVFNLTEKGREQPHAKLGAKSK